MVRQALQQRQPVQAEIANAPSLTEDNLLAWRCFWDLRRGADELAALRWIDVNLWATTYGLTLSEMEELQSLVIVLDDAFLPVTRARHAVALKRAEAEARANAAKGR